MRISTEFLYRRLLTGLNVNSRKMVRAQEQVSSGRRLNRPSDDPTGTARVLTLERELADAGRIRNSISLGRTFVDSAMSALQDATGLLADARSLLIQGMNGTVDQKSRESIADQLDLMRSELLELGNRKSADRFLFAGSQTGDQPWLDQVSGGYQRVTYQGDDATQELRLGGDVTIGMNVPGTVPFAKSEPTGISFSGLSGLGVGSTAAEGTGWEQFTIETTAVDYGDLATAGIVPASGDPTVLQESVISIDAAAETITLGGGKPVPLPASNKPSALNLPVTDANGAVIYLNVSGWNGADYDGTVSGQGTIQMGDGDVQALDFNQTDVRFENPDTGTVVHLDMSAVKRSGEELMQFDGAVNVFDVLAGVVNDLRNGADLSSTEILDRLDLRLVELDRHMENVLVSDGVLGSRSQRLTDTENRFANATLQITGLLSEVEDADFTEVVLDLQQAENTLQLTQATGTRLIQRTLLDFLR